MESRVAALSVLYGLTCDLRQKGGSLVPQGKGSWDD